MEHEAGPEDSRETSGGREDEVEHGRSQLTQTFAFAVVAVMSAVIGGAFILEVATSGAPALAVAGGIVGGVFEGLALLAAVLAVKELRRAPAR